MAAIFAGIQLFLLPAGWLFHAATHPWHDRFKSRGIPAMAVYRDLCFDAVDRSRVRLVGIKIQTWSLCAWNLLVFHLKPGLLRVRA